MTGNPGPSSGRRIRAIASRIATIYKSCALIFFNTLVAYVLTNLALGGIFWMRDLRKSPSGVDWITAKYGAELLDKVYPDLVGQERQVMLSENWNRPYTYDDYTHFQERPIAGKYVNVTHAGYRKSANQGPWPPAPENLNVFVFGGSTTFGYGLPDGETVPSFLQEALAAHAKRRVCVYNFGVGWYYSTQEQIRLGKLLVQGHIPDIAVFVDGMNDLFRFDNRPAFSREMALAFEQVSGFNESQTPSSAGATRAYWHGVAEVTFQRLPIGRAARSITYRLRSHDNGGTAAEENPKAMTQACETYLANKYVIEQWCRRFSVTPVFVWQPAPGYKYDMKYHLFASADAFKGLGAFYSIMRDLHKQGPADPHFLWCADIQQDRAECLYCDYLHYSGAFSKVLADYICQLCLEGKLFDKRLGQAGKGDG